MTLLVQACVELKKMIDDRKRKIQQLSKKQDAVVKNSSMLEDIYEYARTKADVRMYVLSITFFQLILTLIVLGWTLYSE